MGLLDSLKKIANLAAPIAGTGIANLLVTSGSKLFSGLGNFVPPVGEAIESLRRRGKVMFNHTLTLKSKKKKAGSNVFYVSDISVDSDEVQFSDKEKEILLAFQDTINTENEEIVELWRQAKKAEPVSVQAVEAEFDDDPIEVLSS